MRLKHNVHYFYKDKNNEKKTIIRYGFKQYEIYDEHKKYFSMLENKNYDNDLSEFLANKNLLNPLSMEDKPDTMSSKTFNYLTDIIKSDELLNKNIIEDKLKTTFLIIGCGGVGTVILDNLIRIGFTNFVLVDKDAVELSNLNRQLFFDKDDIGLKKISVLLNKTKRITPNNLNLKVIDKYINNNDDIDQIIDDITYDQLFIINCADSPKNINNIIGCCCRLKEIPFLYGFVGSYTGTFGPVYDVNNEYREFETNSVKSLDGSLSTINMILGSHMSHMIFLYCFKDLLDLDNTTFEQHVIKFNNFNINYV